MANVLDVGIFQSGNGLDVGIFQAAATNALTINQSENFNFSDSEIVVLGLLLTFSDPVSLSDSISIQYGNVTVSDTFTFLDGVQVVLTFNYAFTDSISQNDTLTINAGIVEVLGDVLTLIDSIIVSPFTTLLLALTETLTFFDLIQVFTSQPLSFSDVITLSDSTNYSSMRTFQFSDQLALGDSVQLLLAPIRNLQLVESLTLSDVITVNNASIFTPVNLMFNDTLVMQDGIGLTVEPSLISLSDSFMFHDSFTIVIMTNLNPYLRRYLNDVVGISNP